MSSLLGKRYYERTTDGTANNGADDGEDDDYLSDKFLAEIEQSEAKNKKQSNANKSYTQLRKEAQKRSEDKGYIKPRAEREREAREEGLKRNILLMDSSSNGGVPQSWSGSTASEAGTSREGSSNPPPTHAGAGGNKALAMMMKMGFRPGEALGRKVEDATTGTTSTGKGKGRATQITEDSDGTGEEEEDGLAGLGARRGLGSTKKRASTPQPTSTKATHDEDFISINVESEEDDGPPPSHAPKGKSSIPGHRIDPIAIQMRSGEHKAFLQADTQYEARLIHLTPYSLTKQDEEG